jgi:hypothetical protein
MEWIRDGFVADGICTYEEGILYLTCFGKGVRSGQVCIYVWTQALNCVDSWMCSGINQIGYVGVAT